MTRTQNLMPNGIPKYVRCYDNNETVDRYTVVFGKKKVDGEFWCVGMSAQPYHPHGVGSRSSTVYAIDRPAYGHLGKKIAFLDLPIECQRLVISDYKEIWELSS